MRFLSPAATEGLEQLSPIVWAASGDDPGFVFEVDPTRKDFFGFFLMRARGDLRPRVLFDQGAGFNELTALSLKAFPFAFYHLSGERLREVERLRFRPCAGSATFRFLPLRLRNPILVAILHYLFNLRYQKISVVTPDAKGRTSLLSWATSNTARIVKFFRDVSAGAGVRSQEGSKEVLPALKLFMSLHAEAVETRMDALLAGSEAPLISFVAPTYNTSAAYLNDLLQSFGLQNAPYAELILSDDGSTSKHTRAHLGKAANRTGVRVVFNERNRGIAAATNAGIAVARGQWVAFIDHDDQFVPGAIAVIAQAIHDNPEADFFYTDEIIADATLQPVGCFCKPAFDSVMLSGTNYINHFSVFRRARLEELGCLRTDREGSQDYDLLLRYLASPKPGAIVHIPFLAYIWRREERSYSSVHVERSVANARTALQLAYATTGRPVQVRAALEPNQHRISFLAEGPRPTVSVVIPNRNSLALIERVVADLRTRTDYPDLEIVIVDNGTTDPAVLAFYEGLTAEGGVTTDIEVEPFNFARMCNRGARLARGDTLLFLNNDIEAREPGWLAEMVECLSFDAAGIVGARLLYPNGLVQHNGVIVGLGQAAGHWYIGEPADEPGPMGRFTIRQTVSAVTGACMLVKRSVFEALGGFDEVAFAIAYNDIDLCLRARRLGVRTIWTPFATLIHHESVTRGSDETGENNVRFKQEFARLQERHGTVDFIDDAYSPFFDRRYSKPHLIVPPELPSLRPNTFA